MTQSKFDLQNLPDLKIRVANADESERAQCAFFALGYEWLTYGKTWSNVSEKFLFADMDGFLDFVTTKSDFNRFGANTEITLPELEALAAEKASEPQPIQQTNVKESTIFTYHKEGVLKALTFSEAQEQGDKLISEGWKHTATLHAGQFIQNLFNDLSGDEIIEAVYMLDGTKKTKQHATNQI